MVLMALFLGVGSTAQAGQEVSHVSQHPLRMLPGMVTASAPAPSLPVSLISDIYNAPNPFDSRKPGLEGMTQISYTLSSDGPVSINLYDLLGRKVREWTFNSGQPGARTGTNQLLWDGTDESGRKVSKGGYLAQIEVETPRGFASGLLKIGVIH